MTVDFSYGGLRGAAAGNLSVNVSPYGLVDLADEEFEVHGPRLQRYAMHWAFYLGHHWAYRRETGESQLTFNYVKAFTDYIINFCFSRGLSFRSPKETESIVPDLLKRVWEVDNNKQNTLFLMGQQGGVTGDIFVKVAYEEPRLDPPGPEAGVELAPGVMQTYQPGKVRLLPLSSAFCFPEWHPHDRDRMIRFKQKYRFWGTSPEGTRQVFTFTEIITDSVIEEYINDELIRQDPNPLGTIPVVHIPNTIVAGSPWGLPDCDDTFIGLNREYNEKAAEISDILNYHAAPVTVIKGAKASQLEKGVRKVWGGLPKDADIFNLEMPSAGLQLAQGYLESIKRAMHEMVGIPETALGQMQPISNTSGVALSIMFQPLMNRYQQKIVQYSQGIERINALVLRTLAIKEPLSLQWDPGFDAELKPGQVAVLDPNDPISYQSYCHWPPPLPVDRLIQLNEIQAMLALQLESRAGALRVLGEEFPEDKLAEIRAELMEDAKADGALNLLRTAVQAEVMSLTGMIPGNTEDAAQPEPSAPAAGEGGGGAPPAPSTPPIINDAAQQFAAGGQQQVREQLVTLAYGTKLPQRRVPDTVD